MEGILGELHETNISLIEGLIHKRSDSVLFKVGGDIFELPYEDARFVHDNLRPILSIFSELALT